MMIVLRSELRLAIGISTLGVLLLSSFAVFSRIPHSSHEQILVYYVNETIADAENTPNNYRLLSALANGEPKLETIRSSLIADFRYYHQAADKSIADLLFVARKRRFDLAIFSNQLALRGYWLFYKASSDQVSQQPFDLKSPPSTSPVAIYPLASAEVFQKAIFEVSKEYLSTLDIILITNSHGSETAAIAPRVMADVTQSSEADIREALLSDKKYSTPLWPISEGIDKLAYWRVLHSFTTTKILNFPLVVRDSCDSGVTNLAELSEVPDEVSVFASSAGEIAYDAVRYDTLPNSGFSLTDDLITLLRNSGMTIEHRRWLWLKHHLNLNSPLVPFALCIPLTMLLLLRWTGLGVTRGKTYRDRV